MLTVSRARSPVLPHPTRLEASLKLGQRFRSSERWFHGARAVTPCRADFMVRHRGAQNARRRGAVDLTVCAAI